MLTMLNLAIFDSIVDFIKNLSATLRFEYLLYILVGGFLIYAILFFIKTRFSYEVRAIHGFKKINKYLLKHPYVDETNLVEFNRKMKKLPVQIRDRWQYYVLNREGLPSSYLTLYHCVEQPIKTSNYGATVKYAQIIAIIVSILGVCVGMFVEPNVSTIAGFGKALLAPAIFFVLCELYILILKARFNALSDDLYEFYLIFTRNLDKVCVTIPDYIDYEILFTQKEIRDNIPVLREYLEKRAVLEQLEIEKAKHNLSEREKFDFSRFGIDGSLILDRAMNVSQDYLNQTRRLKEEITKLEREKDADKENFTNADKDAERKLQTIKENIDRLQTQIEESASRIEQNYIKKQQSEEFKKRDQITKDLEDMRAKFAQEMKFIDAEIQKRQEEIERGKQEVQTAMDAEFETYSQKVYNKILSHIEEDQSNQLTATKLELEKANDNLEKNSQCIENQNVQIELKTQEIDTLKSEFEKANSELQKFISTDKRGLKQLYDYNSNLEEQVYQLRNELVDYKVRNGEAVYFDENGNIVDMCSYVDNDGHFKSMPKVYDMQGNLIDFAKYYNKKGEILDGVENAPALFNAPAGQQNYLLKSDSSPTTDISSKQENEVDKIDNFDSAVDRQTEDVEPVYYDEKGRVVDFSQYYDENGYFKEFPKVYDAEGNYYDFSLYYDKYGNPLEEENVEEQQVNIERDNVSPVDENSLKIVEENKEKSSQNVEKTESFEGPSTIVEDSMIDENATKNITESKQEDDIKQETNSDQESIASEDAVLKDEQQDEEDPVYYDAKGNVVEFAQFYDENGWFKEFPKVYDAQGNYYDFSLYYDKYGNLLEEYQTMENLGNVSTSNQLEDKSENAMRENVADLKDDDTSGTKSKKATSKKSDNKTSKKSNKTKKSNENVKKDLVESDSENKEPIKKRKMNKISQDSEEGETSGIKPAGVNAVSDLKSKSQNTKVRKSKKETTAKEGDVNVENVVNDSKPSVDENKEVKKSNARKSTSSRKSKNVEQNSDLKTEDPKADATQDIVNNEMEEKSENKKSTKRASKKVETTNVGDADELVSKPKEEIQITKTELKAQISQTLKGLKEINPGSTNLNQLKGIIKTLKAQSAQAKKIGLSEKEQQRINKSLAELLRAMANKK